MTVDPLEELDAIASQADDALRKLRDGRSLTGTSDLTKIKNRARDAARRAREDAREQRPGRFQRSA